MLGRFDTEDVVFEKHFITYTGNNLIELFIVIPNNIVISENPQYFINNTWKDADSSQYKNNFYKDLVDKKIDKTTLNWFDTFDQVIDTVNINPKNNESNNLSTSNQSDLEEITKLVDNFENALIDHNSDKILSYYTNPSTTFEKEQHDFLLGTDIGSKRIFTTRSAGALTKTISYNIKDTNSTSTKSYKVSVTQKCQDYNDQLAQWGNSIDREFTIEISKVSSDWKIDRYYWVGITDEQDKKYNANFLY